MEIQKWYHHISVVLVIKALQLHSALATGPKNEPCWASSSRCVLLLPVHSSSVLSELSFKHSEGSPNTVTSDLHTSLQREWQYYWIPLNLVVSLPLCLSVLFPSVFLSARFLRCRNAMDPLIFSIPSQVLMSVSGFMKAFDHPCWGDLRLFLHAVAGNSALCHK